MSEIIDYIYSKHYNGLLTKMFHMEQNAKEANMLLEWFKALVFIFIISTPMYLIIYATGDYLFGVWAAKHGFSENEALKLSKYFLFKKLFWVGYTKTKN